MIYITVEQRIKEIHKQANNLKSYKYWQDRAERTILQSEKTAYEMATKLEKAYKSSTLKIEKEINAFYGKYAKETGLSMEEVNKLLNKNELKNFKEQAKEYYDNVNKFYDPAYKEHLSRELSAKAYMSRLEELKANIQNEIESLYAKQNEAFTENLNKTFEESYYKTVFDIEQGKGFSVNFVGLNTRVIEKAVQQKWLGENYSDRIWKNKARLISSLETDLTQGFILGYNPKKIAKNIQDSTGTSYNNAVRLARTEFNFIANQATKDAYVQSGVVEAYQVLATLDNRTSNICQEMDQKIFAIGENTKANVPATAKGALYEKPKPQINTVEDIELMNSEQFKEFTANKTIPKNMSADEILQGIEKHFVKNGKPMLEAIQTPEYLNFAVLSGKIDYKNDYFNDPLKILQNIKGYSKKESENMLLFGTKSIFGLNKVNYFDWLQNIKNLPEGYLKNNFTINDIYNKTSIVENNAMFTGKEFSNIKDLNVKYFVEQLKQEFGKDYKYITNPMLQEVITGKKTYNEAVQFEKEKVKAAKLKAKKEKEAKPEIDLEELYKTKMINNRYEADKLLRDSAAKDWNNMTREEQLAAFEYTSGSGKFNRPLSNYSWDWNNYNPNIDINNEGAASEIINLYNTINKSSIPKDIVLNRGADLNSLTDKNTGLFKMSRDEILENKESLIGQIKPIEGFLSTGISSDAGFSDSVKFNIYTPKGSKGIYVEHYSRYGQLGYDGKNWDGKTFNNQINSEAEMILQAGTEYMVKNIKEKSYGTGLEIDLVVINQTKKPDKIKEYEKNK